MEFLIWLAGIAVLGVAGVGAAWAFRQRSGTLDRRFHAADQAARWRHLQKQAESTPGARLAVVQQVHSATPGGTQVVVVWTDTRSVQELWIEEAVAPGDHLLLIPTARNSRPGWRAVPTVENT